MNYYSSLYILLILLCISGCMKTESDEAPFKGGHNVSDHILVTSISGTLFEECEQAISEAVQLEVSHAVHDNIYDTISTSESGEFYFYKVDTIGGAIAPSGENSPLRFRSLADRFDFLIWNYTEYENLKVNLRDSMELYIEVDLETDLSGEDMTLTLFYTPRQYWYEDYFKVELPLEDALKNGINIPKSHLNIIRFDEIGGLELYLRATLTTENSNTYVGNPPSIDKESCVMRKDTVSLKI